MIRLIAWKELRGLMGAPSTWVVLGGLQFILAWSYLGRLDAYIQVQTQMAMLVNAAGATQEVVPYFFNIAGLVVLILTPVFTMRLLAEERRNQTLPLLMSAPVSARQIVLGKFAGLTAFLWLIVLWCTAMAATLRLGVAMDFGLLLSNCLGMLLLAASYAALGMYISSLTAQPIVAAIGALAVLFGLWMVETVSPDSLRFWHVISPTGHFHSFNNGLLDSGDLAYYLVFCVFFLLLAARRLENNRIYG